MELISGGILGSLIGGIFRIAPEVLKWLDKKDDRAHELEMFKNQCQLETQRSQSKLDEIGANHSTEIDAGVMAAFNATINQQTEMVKAAGGWVASLSASVRPVMTYYLLLMYGIVKVCFMTMAFQSGTPLDHAIVSNWTPDDMALLSGIVNFWIIDRSLLKRGL